MIDHTPSPPPPLDKEAYLVGYGRPPKATQFKPGRSGNQKGRPRGNRNVRTEVMDVYLGKVKINDGGRERQVSRLAALYLAQWQRAIKGNERATQTIIASAKSFGLLDKPEANQSSPSLTNETIDALSDEELEQIIKLEEEKKALTDRLRKKYDPSGKEEA